MPLGSVEALCSALRNTMHSCDVIAEGRPISAVPAWKAMEGFRSNETGLLPEAGRLTATMIPARKAYPLKDMRPTLFFFRRARSGEYECNNTLTSVLTLI